MSVRPRWKFIKRFWPFFLSVVIFIAVKIAVRNPDLVEKYYSTGIYPIIAKVFSTVSNLIPFSLWDIFWVLLILLIIAGLCFAVFKQIKFGWYLFTIARIIALGYSFFYISWGFNYFRTTLETRVSWESANINKPMFLSVLDSIIVHTNSRYIDISSSDYPNIEMLIEESYSGSREVLGINYPNGRRRPKRMLFSTFFSKVGLSGYFGPFFNEVHVNRHLLPMDYPFVLAHEKAHQFGITSEAEANLAAYVVCTTSEDIRLQYSGYISLLLYFLSDASEIKDYPDYLKKIDNQIIQDLRYRRKYYEMMENKTLEKIQTATNDAYLKTNNIKEGVMNYNKVVSLVITWYYNLKLIED